MNVKLELNELHFGLERDERLEDPPEFDLIAKNWPLLLI